MTDALPDLAALAAKAEAATRGGWIFRDGHVFGPTHGDREWHRKDIAYLSHVGSSCDGCTTRETRLQDGAYIAAASPECVLALIGEIRRLRRENEALSGLSFDKWVYDSLKRASEAP